MSGIKDLAEVISEDADIVIKEFEEKNIPDFSWSEDAPFAFPKVSPECYEAIQRISAAAVRIQRLATPPVIFLRMLHDKCYEIGAIKALMDLGVPYEIFLNHDISYENLARIVNIDKDLLARYVRLAAAAGFLFEPRPGFVSHNVTSAIFMKDRNTAHALHWGFKEALVTAAEISESFKMDPTGRNPYCSAWSISHKERGEALETYWQRIERVPEDAKEYQSLMTATAKLEQYSMEHVISCFDWRLVNTVVDCGGCPGHISMALADRFHHLKFVVQDLPEAVARGRKSLPKRYRTRITFEHNDLFKSQRVTADAYFYRWIMQLWSDDFARDIIRGVGKAMNHGAKLFINEMLVDDVDWDCEAIEMEGRMTDIRMHALHMGRARSMDEYINLVRMADKRFRFERKHCPPGSFLSVLEFTFIEFPPPADTDGSRTPVQEDYD
ncbi:hypothetical protein DTO212C5_8939 [Paecilomyces variotii]|nr:hypothetical protein DTO212C5_8939 [Paecilomyces variotii]